MAYDAQKGAAVTGGLVLVGVGVVYVAMKVLGPLAAAGKGAADTVKNVTQGAADTTLLLKNTLLSFSTKNPNAPRLQDYSAKKGSLKLVGYITRHSDFGRTVFEFNYQVADLHNNLVPANVFVHIDNSAAGQVAGQDQADFYNAQEQRRLTLTLPFFTASAMEVVAQNPDYNTSEPIDVFVLWRDGHRQHIEGEDRVFFGSW